MSDAPQAQYFLLTTGMSRGQDDATAKKRVCTWWRAHIRLEADGQWAAVNECEDGLMWFSPFALLPVPPLAVPSTLAVYEKVEKRYLAKAKAKREREAKEKAFRKQLASGDIYGLRQQEPEAEPTFIEMIREISEQVYPEPVEASLPLVPAAGLLDDVTVLDLEFQQDSLLEIAAIRFVHGEPVDEYVSLVHFTGQIWAAVFQLTGISSLHVSDPKLPRERQALQQFKKLAGDSLLVCHSIGADKRVLEAARTRQGATSELSNPWLCTLALAKRRVKAGLLPSGQKCGLGELCQHFKIKTRGAHRAKADVLMCHQLLRALHQQQPVTKLDLHGAPQPGKNRKSTPAGPGLLFAA